MVLGLYLEHTHVLFHLLLSIHRSHFFYPTNLSYSKTQNHTNHMALVVFHNLSNNPYRRFLTHLGLELEHTHALFHPLLSIHHSRFWYPTNLSYSIIQNHTNHMALVVFHNLSSNPYQRLITLFSNKYRFRKIKSTILKHCFYQSIFIRYTM